MSDELNFLRSLAAVRLGDSLQSLRQLVGHRWREPLPHEQGKVMCLRHTHAFVAQIDVNGAVGRVEFGTLWVDPPFSPNVDIAGLRAGMPLCNAQLVYPDLLVRSGQHPMPTLGSVKLDANTTLRLQFLFDELRVIGFVNEKAVHPAKVDMVYPAPTEPPGHPFSDPNFKLAVLSDLLDRDIIHLGTKRELASFVLGRPFDIDAEGYEFIRPVYDYLVRYPLTADQMDAVERIDCADGGLSIYSYIWPFWSGHSNVFDVQSVDGVELCRNVTELCDLPPVDVFDFKSANLRRLPKLTRLKLTIGLYSNIEALLDLPALKECHLWGNQIFADVTTPGHPSRRAMDALRARGVKIRVQFISYDGSPPSAFE
ncbi:DUF6892 domain-containing protein [Bradyrhizobium iriomotense]|uniref:Leucine-rich repeat domain-containing protein n=1 Tax=Bradyrhizobium iriomotense TaxID=441950 RepID=A0ABQ6ARF1_9BRAD|nr:hypothetical protein [Bradyrhizobium iriomotense]GLR84734.1 hypothetical protein GCM10007857_14440 [Bradyrhizobium iriomotense]